MTPPKAAFRPATITASILTTVAPAIHPVYSKAFANVSDLFERYGIATTLRVAHFMAQVLHESGRLTILTESLNYSVDALIKKYVPRRMSRADAEKYGRKQDRKADQVAIAKAIYGGEWGRKNLGNTEPTDGWTFRGHGPMQLTGRANFRRIGARIGVDLEAKPALTLDAAHALEIPCIFWMDGKCNLFADRDDVVAVTKAINGGTNGLAERTELLRKVKAALASGA